MTHIMFDIETLGREPGCTILSIGAVTFDPKGTGHSNEFYWNIDVSDSLMNGFTFRKDTIDWWSKQSKNAVSELNHSHVGIEQALKDFSSWLYAVGASQYWCQGMNFDIPIIERAFTMMNIQSPWKFWNGRDTRTVYDVCGFNPKSVKREGTYHNALSDAIHQVDCLQKALKSGIN